MDDAKKILTINCGSSSLKFALYLTQRTTTGNPQEKLRYVGAAERIGAANSAFHIADGDDQPLVRQAVALDTQQEALEYTLDWLEQQPGNQAPDAVGHRIVHGGAAYEQPQRITDEVIATLRRIAPLAPLHMPVELAAIETIRTRYPALPQVACFDTAFHRTMPRVAQMYGLPRHFLNDGVLRYGFHGLSYEYITSELAREMSSVSKPLTGQRVIIAHLGNGASMVAVQNGRSIDTTMGLTPIGGLVMSTRSGDLDPGVLLYLLDAEKMSSADIRSTVEQAGGLLGVSGSSSDMRDLLAHVSRDAQAAEAVALFCYTAQKHLGALVSVLGGIDTLVFTGGIGEHAAEVRRQICSGFVFLGIQLDPVRNAADAPIISDENCPVTVRVIHTNEELMIARHTIHALQLV
jgi:acetate kinase